MADDNNNGGGPGVDWDGYHNGHNNWQWWRNRPRQVILVSPVQQFQVNAQISNAGIPQECFLRMQQLRASYQETENILKGYSERLNTALAELLQTKINYIAYQNQFYTDQLNQKSAQVQELYRLKESVLERCRFLYNEILSAGC